MLKKRALFLWGLSLIFAAFVHAAPETCKVCFWNIQNFGPADRMSNGQYVAGVMKPEREIASLMAILQKIRPDVLAVAEVIQDPQDRHVKLLRERLLAAGLDYRWMSTTHGVDSRIQNVLFSRYPIVEESHEAQEQVRRGILNAVVEVRPDVRLRLLAVHLKSKLANLSHEGAASLQEGKGRERLDERVRRQEALLVRGTLTRALQKNPHEKILLMGDLNDTPRSQAVRTILGGKDAAVRVYDLWLTDYLGDWWTHYYASERQYERLDYMVVSQELFKDWIKEESYLYRNQGVENILLNTYTPSDHRPLVAVFKVSDAKR